MSSLFSCFIRDKPPPTPPLPDPNMSIFRSLIESYKALKSSYSPTSLPPLLLPPSSLLHPSSLLSPSSSLMPPSSSLLPHSSSLLPHSSSLLFPPSSLPTPVPPSSRKQRKWSPLEDATLKELQLKYKGNWELIGYLLGRTVHQCRHRWKKIGGGRERKKWNEEEDQRVIELFEKYGKNWHKISIEMENRTGKQIRDRYNNVLNPKRKTDDWSKSEDEKLMSLYREVGGKWKFISEKINGRTENMVKNRWNHYLKFKMEIKQETQCKLFFPTHSFSTPLLALHFFLIIFQLHRAKNYLFTLKIK